MKLGDEFTKMLIRAKDNDWYNFLKPLELFLFGNDESMRYRAFPWMKERFLHPGLAAYMLPVMFSAKVIGRNHRDVDSFDADTRADFYACCVWYCSKKSRESLVRPMYEAGKDRLAQEVSQ